MQSDSELLGVRFLGPELTLKHVEEAAAKAGWTNVQHDQSGSILVLAPTPYGFEQFQKLIDAMNSVPERDFSLQLVGPDGKPVNLGPPDSAN
ncbi:MAG TPA: hypothetical protein VFI88_04255 [Sphingomicrobium sp.]|jgi:hypothetical protein|nr:hypothetical protein [Sphingomicrobium sp.]